MRAQQSSAAVLRKAEPGSKQEVNRKSPFSDSDTAQTFQPSTCVHINRRWQLDTHPPHGPGWQGQGQPIPDSLPAGAGRGQHRLPAGGQTRFSTSARQPFRRSNPLCALSSQEGESLERRRRRQQRFSTGPVYEAAVFTENHTFSKNALQGGNV